MSLRPEASAVDRAGADRAARPGFGPAERAELALLYGAIALLHVAGLALLLGFAAQMPGLAGLGLAAYLFGLRHGFDADHIAAVDDTVRYLINQRRNPLAVGFFFSLGHCTVVFVVALVAALAASTLADRLVQVREIGTVVGLSVSGVFLLWIGLMNLRVLLGIARSYRRDRAGCDPCMRAGSRHSARGGVDQPTRGRLDGTLRNGWQMYPVGLLFGLGLDSAAEVGLLALAASAMPGEVPVLGVLALPILFAAGMTAVDTSDGVFMCRAYRWANADPARRLRYNLLVTAISVAIALSIGGVELAQALVRAFDLSATSVKLIADLDFGATGYAVVVLFILTRLLAVGIGRSRARADDRRAPLP